MTSKLTALEYAQQLMKFDSTSRRSNAKISDCAAQLLEQLGFETERISYDDENGVKKVSVIGRRGSGPGGLAYFGHTDVVPADTWADPASGPFDPIVRAGRLVGRGSTDMKGSIACMLAAAAKLVDRELRSPIYISCTADEELNHRGADEIVQRSKIYRQLVEGGACGIVGEPTQLQVVYAHKGGCRVTVTSRGKAAHSSTREGVNANLAMIPFLAEMKAIHDETETEQRWLNNEFDPPSVCWNIGINDLTQATNITPPQSICTIAFRPMPGTDTEQLVTRLQERARQLKLDCCVNVLHPPFRTDPGSEFVRHTVELAGAGPPQTVSYGTEASNLKDIRNLIVLGPGSIAQAHTHDEWIELDQLEKGTAVYGKLLERFCL